MSTPMMSLAQIRCNLTIGQLEIPAKRNLQLVKRLRISFSASLLSCLAVLVIAQTEERGGGSSDFAALRQFLPTLQYLLEIMINYILMVFIPKAGEHSWLYK